MNSITDIIALFRSQLSRVSPTAMSRLAPGLSHSEVSDRLSGIGLDPPEDVLSWFAWQNGSLTPDVSPWMSIPIGPAFSVISLDQLIAHYTWWTGEIQANLPQKYERERTWFPLAQSDSTYLVADCSAEPSTPVRCALQTPSGGVWSSSLPLRNCLQLWIDAIEDGRWRCEDRKEKPPKWVSSIDWEALPDEIKRTSLFN